MIPANNHPEIDCLIHLKKHLGGMTMSKLISYQFNIDTACVELVFDDRSQISIDFTAVESEAADNRFQQSELDYLIYNDPLAYVPVRSVRIIPYKNLLVMVSCLHNSRIAWS